MCFLSSFSAKIQEAKPWLHYAGMRTSKQNKREKGKRRTVKKLDGITVNYITVL